MKLWEMLAQAAPKTDTKPQPQLDAESTLADVAGILEQVRRVAQAISDRSARSGMDAMLAALEPTQAGLVVGAVDLIRAVWAQASPRPFPTIYAEAQPVVEPEPVEPSE